MLSDVCGEAVAYGAVSCVVIDADTGKALAGVDRGASSTAAALLEVLSGRAQVASPFGRAPSTAAANAAQEFLIVGDEHATFACLTGVTRYFVLLVAPTSLSVALGWSLLRRIVAAAEVSA
jgi:hypothetical protein